jgi:deazaflavin-dependent oxidoreductase (nitroreductase family)
MSRPKGSAAWRATFKFLLRAVPRPIALAVARRTQLPYTELVVVGRSSGLPRSTVVTLFELGGHWYVGNPNGDAQWTRNLAAARSGVLVRGDQRTKVAAIVLPAGEERDAVVRGTSRQPPPASLVYRLGRRHVSAAGTYFRLELVQRVEAAS